MNDPDATTPKKSNSKDCSGTPPAPTHVMGCHAQNITSEEKAAAGNRLIAEVQTEGKFKDYTSAREEARRRVPGLFE